MSTHVFTLTDKRKAAGIVAACHEAGHGPTAVTYDEVALTISLSFSPDLTAGEQSALAEIVRAAETDLTRAERNAIQSDIDLLVTFQGIATPTLAQTAAATKAQSRILRALLRS